MIQKNKQIFEDEVEIDNIVYYVIAETTWECYMDGIGSYEYWGSKCYDNGSFCADLEDILIQSIFDFDGNEIQVSDEIKKKIEDYIVDVVTYDED